MGFLSPRQIRVLNQNSADANPACRWHSATWSSFENSYQSRKAFGAAIFCARCAGCPKPCIIGACVLRICVSPRSLNQKKGGSLGRAGSASSSGLSDLSLVFADANGVCCSKRCWNWPVRGGWGQVQRYVEELFEFAKLSAFCNSQPVQGSYCETSPALSCFWKSIFGVFASICF